jgi:HemY protein
MFRAIIFFVKLAIVVAIAFWLAERPGAVSLEWLGYHIETSMGILLLAVFVLMVAAALGYRFARTLLHAPSDISQAVATNRRRRGYKALTKGMVAVAAGDADEARRCARKADNLLEEPPLTMLLQAQAAQLSGDERAAKRYFEAMLERDDMAFLGLRGLLMQARREGNEAAALEYVERARQIRPDAGWVLNNHFDLQLEEGDFKAAEETVKEMRRHRILPREDVERRQAVILTERARTMANEGGKTEAAKLAREAHELAPDLAPAAALAGKLWAELGSQGRAARLLERAWPRAPHPELAEAYLITKPAKDALDRLRHITRLTERRPEGREAQLLLARANLDAQLWGEARRHLTAIDEHPPSESVCRLMAELAECEHGDGALAKVWLERATEAPPDPAWICGNCGAASEEWSAVCGNCGAFDNLAWQSPPHVGAYSDVTFRLPTDEATPAESTGSTQQEKPRTLSETSDSSVSATQDAKTTAAASAVGSAEKSQAQAS